jgi:hypothetical protein
MVKDEDAAAASPGAAGAGDAAAGGRKKRKASKKKEVIVIDGSGAEARTRAASAPVLRRADVSRACAPGAESESEDYDAEASDSDAAPRKAPRKKAAKKPKTDADADYAVRARVMDIAACLRVLTHAPYSLRFRRRRRSRRPRRTRLLPRNALQRRLRAPRLRRERPRWRAGWLACRPMLGWWRSRLSLTPPARSSARC